MVAIKVLKNSLSQKSKLLISLILILGAFLRFYHLSTKSFWHDETATVNIAKAQVPQILELTVRQKTWNQVMTDQAQLGFFGDGHPPLLYLLVHFMFGLFGPSEFTARFFSALAGTISVLLFYLIVKRLLNEKTALLGSFLFALSPLQIHISQEARPHAIGGMFSLLMIFLLVKYLQEKKNKFPLEWLLSTTGGIFSSYVNIALYFLLFAFGTFTLYIKKEHKRLKKWAISNIPMFILIGLEIFLARHHFLSAAPQTFQPTNRLKKIGAILVRYSSGYIIKPIKTEAGAIASFKNIENLLLYIFASLVFAIAIMGFFKIKERMPKQLITLFLFAFAIIIAFLPLNYISPRYFMFIFASYLLALSSGILSLKKKSYIITLLIVSVSLYSLIIYYPLKENPEHPENYREMALYLKKNANQRDILIQFASSVNVFAYLEKNELPSKAILNPKEFKTASKGYQRVWFPWQAEMGDPYPGKLFLVKAMEPHQKISKIMPFGKNLYLFCIENIKNKK